MVFLYGDGRFDNYRAAIEAVGGHLLISTDLALAQSCEGLLLPGGGDICGALDGEEADVIQFFVDHRRPILGICRGMQALNVFFGGSLYDYIPGHQLPQGDILHATSASGCLCRLLGEGPTVNSNHHQAIKTLGRGLRICQWSRDGVIEGICHCRLPILGVQWHPERQSFALRRADAVDAAPIFDWFMEAMEK